VVTFDDTRERKPGAAPFREVLARLEVPAAESLMVGDWAERDVVGGKSLGMMTAFARYGDTFDTAESGADFDINDIVELVEIVDRINGSAAARPADAVRRPPAAAR
jgi:putative hydrolase of the HAD superfamily